LDSRLIAHTGIENRGVRGFSHNSSGYSKAKYYKILPLNATIFPSNKHYFFNRDQHQIV
jgi:hypothetical protein